MTDATDADFANTHTDHVTYVVVVHGMGEQRKNETVINVVNRFAEARRSARAEGNRDVLTLGLATGQTGLAKVPAAERPWMEFDGIPPVAGPNGTPFLGQPSPGNNLRFVDLCWSDVMQDSIDNVGQDVDDWAKGLLGRLLRKHEAAESAKNPGAEVPFWIRRVLYLLADTLLLLRFAMSFRFKGMKDLVFAKFLGDVQLYGEYSRCRGRAVRRFHEMMARIEAEHVKRESECGCAQPREARYVVIAHSLGSIMSLDALLYAAAPLPVRCGCDPTWIFPGYIRDDDTEHESHDRSWVDEVREAAPTGDGSVSQPAPQHAARCQPSRCRSTRDLEALKDRFPFLDTKWIKNVQSFVTLGSPIDKYLTIWWLNYRYLLNDDRFPCPEHRIAHFNYADELDPVGHKLDVACVTPAYRAVFDCKEDVVFNRYTVPGAAHNAYWTDQCLFIWILAKAVDQQPGKRPRWFDRRVYGKLLSRLYCWVPFLTLFGSYGSLSLALAVTGWRTAALAAGAFVFLMLIGRRLIDLGIWWRRLQRQESATFWRPAGDGTIDQDIGKQRQARDEAAGRFRLQIVAVPLVLAVLTVAVFGVLGCMLGIADHSWDWAALRGAFAGGGPARVLLILVVTTAVVWLVGKQRLPDAYRTPAVGERNLRAEGEAAIVVLGSVLAGFVGSFFVPHALETASWQAGYITHGALLMVLATAVYAYRWRRFMHVRRTPAGSPPPSDYSTYAKHP